MFNIVYRLLKGEELTYSEVDNNFKELADKSVDKSSTEQQNINGDFGIDGPLRHRFISWLTNGVLRWGFFTDASAEDGANKGSNFYLRRFSDAGVSLGDVLSVNRASGIMDYTSRPTVGGSQVMVAGDIDTSAYVRRDGTSKMFGSLDVDYALARLLVGSTTTVSDAGIIFRTKGAGASTVSLYSAGDNLNLIAASGIVTLNAPNVRSQAQGFTFGYGYNGALTVITDASATGLYGNGNVIFGNTSTTGYADLMTNSLTRVRVLPNGNVLIGTTVDQGYALNVKGGVYASDSFYSKSYVVVPSSTGDSIIPMYGTDGKIKFANYKSDVDNYLLIAYDNAELGTAVYSVNRLNAKLTFGTAPAVGTADIGNISADAASTAFVKAYSDRVGSVGIYETRNVIGATNTVKQIIIASADYIRLVRADGTTLRVNQGVALNADISVAGPVAGGRDQAAAFAAGSFTTAWYIYNETTGTLALVASASQIQPAALPPGYTAWARAGIWRIDGNGNLVSQRWHHKTAYYNADCVVIQGSVASNGAEILASPAPTVYVPAAAYEYNLRCLGQVTVASGNPASGQFLIRSIASGFAQEFSVLDDNAGGNIGERRTYLNLQVENTGYLSVAGIFTYGNVMNLYARIHSYTIP